MKICFIYGIKYLGVQASHRKIQKKNKNEEEIK
jgi:hypothetical protein